jgi:hypothetical protein
MQKKLAQAGKSISTVLAVESISNASAEESMQRALADESNPLAGKQRKTNWRIYLMRSTLNMVLKMIIFSLKKRN